MIEVKLLVGRCMTLLTPHQTDNGPPDHGFQRLNQKLLHINPSTRAHGFWGTKTSTVGEGHVAKDRRNYQWLEWRPGLVTEVVQGGIDVLTGPMSGCWITRYTRLGVQCVGHVGTSDNPGSPETVAVKAAWNAFRQGPPAVHATGFNPLRNWRLPFPAAVAGEGPPKIFGLVTAAGEFFSVFTYPLANAAATVRIAGLQRIASTLPPIIV